MRLNLMIQESCQTVTRSLLMMSTFPCSRCSSHLGRQSDPFSCLDNSCICGHLHIWRPQQQRIYTWTIDLCWKPIRTFAHHSIHAQCPPLDPSASHGFLNCCCVHFYYPIRPNCFNQLFWLLRLADDWINLH